MSDMDEDMYEDDDYDLVSEFKVVLSVLIAEVAGYTKTASLYLEHYLYEPNLKLHSV